MALEGLQKLVGGVEGCWAPGVWDGAGLSGWEVTVAWSAQDLWACCPPVGSQCGGALAAAALYFPYHFKAVCCLCVLLGHKLWMRGSVRSGEAGGLMTREREREPIIQRPAPRTALCQRVAFVGLALGRTSWLWSWSSETEAILWLPAPKKVEV